MATPQVQRLCAFSIGAEGGNHAGVVLTESMPSAETMQGIAKEVGFSETAFAAPIDDGKQGRWRVRYFAPQMEVPFCGHATIALGAALAQTHGDDIYELTLNEAEITVEGKRVDGQMTAALQSPPTRSSEIATTQLAEMLALFGISPDALDARLPARRIHAGADHFLLPLKSRQHLAGMAYDFDAGKKFMNRNQVVTIVLAYVESPQRFHTRNAFAAGGVVEDAATGAATAALAGYLRELDWPHGNKIEIIQGEDMGMRSRLFADFTSVPGNSIRVSGEVRPL